MVAVDNDGDDDSQFPLPGFRFHPTDEELVNFYLRRKVHNKPLPIELIKQIDIYKYSPWDLPHASNGSLGEKEWYFFCKRGRKYKNSVRPNRVTGCGFWKATGIDKPIYINDRSIVVGLKKTLVYYRGSAGKGTKTEWMMNEFRLPSSSSSSSDPFRRNIITNNLHEAEIWTLCRIFKRNISAKKAINAPWREVPSAKSRAVENMNFRATTNIDINRYFDDDEQSSYINFTSNNSFINFDHVNDTQNFNQSQMSHSDRFMTNFCNSTDLPPSIDHYSSTNVSPSSSSFSDFDEDATDLFGYEKWEELKSILECDFDS
ncbi:unnamed protein product [Citrullus colocynthis]|uniref:NAC domain-containing protein n=1 Tax=Citrullus colocynthis TaxID=252529 RepID=A0ABP0Y4N6_9ROSI